MLDLPALYAECAPAVHPDTMAAVVRVESGGNPLALNVNRLAGERPPRPADPSGAARIARRYIARGSSVDIGLGQINSRNLPALGLTVEQVLEPCTNLRASAAILAANYASALGRFDPGRPALLAALSAYNTGTWHRGFVNGYVARFVPAPGGPLPQRAPAGVARATPVRPASPFTADTTVAWSLGG